MVKSAFEEPSNFPDRVTFGKYKGCDIRDVPTDYIEWFVGAGTPGTARYQMFEEELKRRRSGIPATPIGGGTQAETEDTQPKEEQPEKLTSEPTEDLLMVFSKEKIEELVVSAYTRGYNDAYARLAVNIKAIPYVQTFNIQRFKQELLSSLQENRPIDTMKYEKSPKTEKQVDGGNDKASSRKSWYSQDNRK